MTEKEVKRIEQKGDIDGIPPFSRYEDVVLTFSQLKKVVKDKDWMVRKSWSLCWTIQKVKNP